MNLDKGTGFVCSPSCGDVLKLKIEVDDEGIVEKIHVSVFGCDAAKSMKSRLEQITGLPIDEIIYMNLDDFAESSDENNHIAVLALNGIRSAVTDYAEKKYEETQEEEEKRPYVLGSN